PYRVCEANLVFSYFHASFCGFVLQPWSGAVSRCGSAGLVVSAEATHRSRSPRVRGMSGAQASLMVTIAALNPDARPRERLLSCGAAQLADQELLAIVLGSGTAGRNVMQPAPALLADSGGLVGLAQSSVEELCAHSGVGRARASLIQA